METKVNPAKTTVVIVLAAVLFMGGRGALGAVHESTLTIDGNKVAGDLNDFVVYVDLAHMDHGFWDHVTIASGTTDIVVKNAGGTVLSREIVWLNKDSRKGEMHFKADSLSGTSDTSFAITVGGGASMDNRNTNTWSNGYLGVWHLGEATGNYSNSAAAENEGGRNGDTCVSVGKFGGAQSFDGEGDYIVLGSLGDYDGSSATVSAWVRLDELPSDSHATVWGNSEGGDNKVYLFCSKDDQKLTAFGRNEDSEPWSLPDLKSDAAMSTHTWQYVSLCLDNPSGTAKLYLDDAEFGPGTYSTIPANSHEIGTVRGSHFFDGLIDEFRISNVVRSADWILTEYNNQSSPGEFYTVIPEPGTLMLLCGVGGLSILRGLKRERRGDNLSS